MELWELKQKVVEKNLPNLLVFIAEEPTLTNTYIDQISKSFNNKYNSMESVIAYLNFQSQKNIFRQDINMTVIRGDKDIVADEAVWSRLEKISNLLILVYYNKSDISKKIWDKYKDNIVIFEKMSKEVLKGTLSFSIKNANIKLDEVYIDWLIDACNEDYGRCLSELDKLLIFKDSPVNHQDLFRQFVKDGSIHVDISDCIFDYSNAFIERKVKDVYKIYEDLKQTEDVPFVALKVLQNSFRNLLAFQTAGNPTPESCGVSEKQFKALRYKPKKYSPAELRRILILISEIDRNIKLGLIEDTMALEYLMAKVL